MFLIRCRISLCGLVNVAQFPLGAVWSVLCPIQLSSNSPKFFLIRSIVKAKFGKVSTISPIRFLKNKFQLNLQDQKLYARATNLQ